MKPRKRKRHFKTCPCCKTRLSKKWHRDLNKLEWLKMQNAYLMQALARKVER